MKSTPRTLIAATLLVAALGWPAPSHAILGFLKKDLEKAPSGTELRSQESAAIALYNQASSKEKAGKHEDARKILEDVVREYPLTETASKSQFEIGQLREKEGKPSKAFDAYQDFVDNYKGSSLFGSAVKRQYEIAMAGHQMDEGKFLLFSSKPQPSRLVEMFEAITKNAPFSAYAPLAQYTVGEVYEGQDDTSKAVEAFQKVVEDYPNNPKAAEAQYQIGQLLTSAGEKGNNDQAHLQKTREAYEEFLIQFPENALATDAKQQLTAIQAKEVAKSFEIAQFYEKTGNYKAATIYYKDVAKYPGASQYQQAEERIAALSQYVAATSGEARPVAVAAAVDVKNRDDYLGPPAPDLAKVANKPSMRTSLDDVAPIPAPEPALPERAASAPASPSPAAAQQTPSAPAPVPATAAASSGLALPAPPGAAPASPDVKMPDAPKPLAEPPAPSDLPEINVSKSAEE